MHLKQIDGLRAVAVLGVVWSHAAPTHLLGGLGVISGGWGVKLFFVISGYLITSILLRSADEVEDGRRMAILKPFYIRRSLRIWPGYYAAIALGLVVAWRSAGSTLRWNLVYLSNVQIARIDVWPALTGHFWSLAVEEQFYLFWPAVFLFTPKRFRLAAAITLTVIGPVALAATYGWGGLDYIVFTPVHFDTLGLGAVLAVVAHADARDGTRWTAGLWVGGLALGAMVFEVAAELWQAAPGIALAIRGFGSAMMLVGLVGFATRQSRSVWGWIFECRPLCYIGRISYGIYLYHLIVLHVVRRLFGYAEFEVSVVIFLLTLAGSVLLADLSWRVLEDPVNRLKRLFPYTAPQEVRARDLPGAYATELASAARRCVAGPSRIGVPQRQG